MNEAIGVIFPLPRELIDRFFDERKSVFGKYLPRDSTTLHRGMRLFFYESARNKSIVGEAIIEKVEFLQLEDVIQKYKNSFFLTEKELYIYSGDRKKRSLLVLVLKNISKYSVPIRYDKPITMTGRFLGKEEYSKTWRS